MLRNKRCHHNEKPTHSDEDPVRPKNWFLCSSLSRSLQSPFTLAPVLLLFSCSVVSCSLLTHGLQHTRLHHLLSTISWSLLKLMSVESVMPSNKLILCHSLLLLSSIFPRIRFFPNESALCIKWPKYWSFSFSISPSNEYSGLISFRMDWFDILAVQGTLRCLLQHQKLKASILQCSASFMIQLSHPYMTTVKNHGFDYMDLCLQNDVFAF